MGTNHVTGALQPKGRLVGVSCAKCGQSFVRQFNRLREQGEHFCSRSCYHAAIKGRPRSPRCDTGMRKSFYVDLSCANCAKPFARRQSEVRNQRFQFCSRDCYKASGAARAGKRGGRPRSSEWAAWLPEMCQPETFAAVEKYGQPEGWTIDRGYLTLLWPRHPGCGMNGRIAEHRAVAYEHVGEAIRGQHVDHVDQDRRHNSWSNLQVLSPSDHARKTSLENAALACAFLRWCKSNHPGLLNQFRIETEASRL